MCMAVGSLVCLVLVPVCSVQCELMHVCVCVSVEVSVAVACWLMFARGSAALRQFRSFVAGLARPGVSDA